MMRESARYFADIFPFNYFARIAAIRGAAKEAKAVPVEWSTEPFVPPWEAGIPIESIRLERVFDMMIQRPGIYRFTSYDPLRNIRFIRDNIDNRLLDEQNRVKPDILDAKGNLSKQLVLDYFESLAQLYSKRQRIASEAVSAYARMNLKFPFTVPNGDINHHLLDEQNCIKPDVFDDDGNLDRESVLRYIRKLAVYVYEDRDATASQAVRAYAKLSSGLPYTIHNGDISLLPYRVDLTNEAEVKESETLELRVMRTLGRRGIQVEISPTHKQIRVKWAIGEGCLEAIGDIHKESPLEKKLAVAFRHPKWLTIHCSEMSEKEAIPSANGNGHVSESEAYRNRLVHCYFIIPPEYAAASSG